MPSTSSYIITNDNGIDTYYSDFACFLTFIQNRRRKCIVVEAPKLKAFNIDDIYINT